MTPIIRATTIDAYRRPDGHQLQHDVTVIASGRIPITQDGCLTPEEAYSGTLNKLLR